MCNTCHSQPRISEIVQWNQHRDATKLSFVIPCTDPKLCPLGIGNFSKCKNLERLFDPFVIIKEHPPAGEEFGFGCAECKREKEEAEATKANNESAKLVADSNV